MKRPLCKVCQNHHYSHEPHIWLATDEAGDDEIGVVEKRRTDDKPAELGRAVIRERVKAGTISDRSAAIALTMADRSARYRAKQKLEGPEFLEREKARMRARRKK